MASTKPNNRILSVDVLRGITICLMIIVNNGPGESWHFLRHVEWNGMTPCDMVFPFFLFTMGVSIYLSLSKNGFEANWQAIKKVLVRSLEILLVCYGIFWFARICRGDFFPFAHFRLTGVLARIAVAYCCTAILALKLDHKWLLPIAIGLLAIYTAIILLGNGYANDATNIIARIDKAILGQNHLYTKTPVDPEGLLGIIPSVAHAILGFLCGKVLKSSLALEQKTYKMAERGAVMLIIGFILTIVLPLNKRIWSPSFVLVTCGAAALLLAVLMYFIDMKKHDKWCTFFNVFGVNSLFLYVLSEVLDIVFGCFDISWKTYSGLTGLGLPAGLSSFIYAALFMLVNWAIGYILYKKKIYIKL